MKEFNEFVLEDIIDKAEWQRLQDAFADAAGLEMITVDYMGNSMSQPSRRNKLCELIRNTEGLKECCVRCDSRGCVEAARSGNIFLYMCHCGLVDAAIPLYADNHFFGAVIAGGCMMTEHMSGLEFVHGLSDVRSKIGAELTDTLQRENEISNEDFLKKICAVHEITEIILEKAFFSSQKASKSKWKAKKDDKAGTPSEYIMLDEDSFSKSTPILKPAFDYIAVHFNKKISVKEMADLCHISTSYFSKLFVQQTRMTFSDFVIILRLEWAKQQLAHSENSIADIGYGAGFGDSSHFIKTFKRIEGITPLQYRRRFL